MANPALAGEAQDRGREHPRCGRVAARDAWRESVGRVLQIFASDPQTPVAPDLDWRQPGAVYGAAAALDAARATGRGVVLRRR